MPALPWEPVKIDETIRVAVQAMARGQADELQQKGLIRFLKKLLCEQGKTNFYGGGRAGDRATAFAAGKRWVANEWERIENLRRGAADSRGPPPPMPGEPEE